MVRGIHDENRIAQIVRLYVDYQHLVTVEMTCFFRYAEDDASHSNQNTLKDLRRGGSTKSYAVLLALFLYFISESELLTSLFIINFEIFISLRL